MIRDNKELFRFCVSIFKKISIFVKTLNNKQSNKQYLRLLFWFWDSNSILSATVSYNSEPVSPLVSATGISGKERWAAVLALYGNYEH